MRDQYKDHPHFQRTAHFCKEYDNPAFDPERETLSLAFFEPMLKQVFSVPKHSIYMDEENKLPGEKAL